MKKILIVLDAIIGFSGSSENPNAVSLRLTATFVGAITPLVPFATLLIAHMMPNVDATMVEAYANNLAGIAQPVILLGACLMWIIGVFKAGYKAWVQPTVAGFMGRV